MSNSDTLELHDTRDIWKKRVNAVFTAVEPLLSGRLEDVEQTELEETFLGLDAGTLQGHPSTDFALTGHGHTAVDVFGPLSANKLLVTNSLGAVTTSSTSAPEVSYLSGTTSNIQAQLDDKLSSSAISGVTGIELSYLAGVTAPLQTQIDGKADASGIPAEVVYLTGITDNLQDQLDAKADTVDLGGASPAQIGSLIGVTAPVQGQLNAKANAVDIPAEVVYLVGVTSPIQGQLNGKASAADLGGASPTEIGYLSGATGNIQSQLDAKPDVADFGGATPTELGYVSGVTSPIQGQLNGKVDSLELGAINGIAQLGSDQKLLLAQLPDLSITDTFVVSDEPAMLALVAQKGDVAIRTDNSLTYILAGTDPSVAGNWQQLLTGSAGVLSVFGRSGNISAQPGDYSAGDISRTPTGALPQTNVESALDAIASDLATLDNGLSTHTHDAADTHNNADTDSAPSAIHHTLGVGANQAAAGNHLHTGVYSPFGHDHDGTYEPVFTKNSAFNKNFGVLAGTVAEGNHTHIGTFAPAVHTHNAVDVHNNADTDSSPTSLHHTIGTSANQAAAGNHLHIGVYEPVFSKGSAFNKDFGGSGSATTVAHSDHSHVGTFAPVIHTHTVAESHNSADTDSAPTALHHTLGTSANQAAAGNHLHTGVYEPVFTKSSAFNKDFDGSGSATTVARSDHSHVGTYALASHNHSATEITSGTLAAARLSGSYDISITGSAYSIRTSAPASPQDGDVWIA